jgi:Septum formation initiator
MAARARGGRRARLAVRRRWLVAATVVVVAFVYSQPLRTYLRTRHALDRRVTEVARLQAERHALELRLARSLDGPGLLREARRIGYIRPGERLYIVRGIDRWRREQRRENRTRG